MWSNFPSPVIPPSSGDVYVIPSAAEIVGVLKLPANILNAKWTHLVELNPDGFVVINSECNLKIVVQVIHDSGSGEEELDIAAWGDLWCQHLKQLK
jgi:hypothetical protein